jgi:hypothetical protein
MSEIYPKLNENLDKPSELESKPVTINYRIQKINEINSFFEKEIEDRRKILRKYKGICSAVDVLNITAGVGSTALGIGTIGLVSFAILPPVAISLEAAAIGICASTILFEIIHKKLNHKIEKHKSIYACAVAKLSTIHDIYKKSMEDGKIDDNEFKLFLNEKDKYLELKNKIRKNSLDNEQKINLEDLKNEFLERGKQMGKQEVWKIVKASA